jgi:hypothetical protein
MQEEMKINEAKIRVVNLRVWTVLFILNLFNVSLLTKIFVKPSCLGDFVAGKNLATKAPRHEGFTKEYLNYFWFQRENLDFSSS